MPAGIVKVFYRSKGYGFVRAENDMKDVFVHRTAFETGNLKELRKGQKVTFDIVQDQGRFVAKNLRLIEEDSGQGDPMLASTEGGIGADVTRDAPDKFDRKPVTRAILEKSLTDAVRKVAPECEAFVGVIVERVVPKTRNGVNWVVKGVRYGKANRSSCETALNTTLREEQQKYALVDDQSERGTKF